MAVQIRIEGLNDIIDMLDEIEKGDWARSTMHEIGANAKRYAKDEYCPVDTGELRSSIYLRSDKNGFQLFATAPHAIFNEYGSIFTPIGSVENPKKAKKKGFRPFLRPAIYKATGEAEYLFRKKLAKIISHG